MRNSSLARPVEAVELLKLLFPGSITIIFIQFFIVIIDGF